MIQCKICNEKSRRKPDALEHYERFHAPPKLNEDGTIQINACHKIELILKGDQTWEERRTAQRKQDKKNKKTDESAWRSMAQLETFEKQNGIEFGYCKEGEFFTQ